MLPTGTKSARMQRSRSAPAGKCCSRIEPQTTPPPWERQDVVPVPFMDASSPSLSDTEHRALPDLWAQPRISPPGPPHIDEDRKTPVSDDEKTCSSTETNRKQWDQDHGPWISDFQSPAPYETQVYIPQPPKTAPPPQKQVGPKAPPSPPETLSNSSSFSCPAGTAGQTPPVPIVPFPGTMSNRSRENGKVRARSSNGGRIASKHSRSDSANFGTRFKTAFRGMFTRSPIDESQLERIEDKHWTEEY